MSAIYGGRPHGHLRDRGVAPIAAFGGHASHELAAELRRRIRGGEALAGDVNRAELFALLGFDLEASLESQTNRFSRTYASNLFRMFTESWRANGLKVEGAVVAELGCGSLNPAASLAVFTLLGARRAVGIDLDPPQDVAIAARAVARCAAWMLIDPGLLVGDYPITREQVAANVRAARLDLRRLFDGDPAGVDPDRLTLRLESASRLSFRDGEVDALHSNSFFEHVEDPEGVIAEAARVTRRGGFGAHGIDCSDHRHHSALVSHPLDFLTLDTRDAIVHECNRLRLFEYLPLFERHGFKVERVSPWQRVPVPPELQATYAPPYRDMPREQLELLGGVVHVRRV